MLYLFIGEIELLVVIVGINNVPEMLLVVQLIEIALDNIILGAGQLHSVGQYLVAGLLPVETPFNLITELTVEQNILFPVLLDYQKPDRAYLEELLTVLNLKDRRKHLPSQLSGGQQQRVAIGRALMTRPSLILADEPTGNLDTQNTSEVIALLKETSRKYEQTILMITHNRSIAQTADRVLQVSDGCLTDFGRCRE